MRFAPSVFVLAAWIFHGTGCGLQPAAKDQPKRPVTQAVTPALEASPAGTEDKLTPMPIDRNAQVVVLGYHRVVNKVRHPDTEITPRDFEAQMQQIKDAGISVISMKDLSCLASRRKKHST